MPFFYLDEEGRPAGLEYDILSSFAEAYDRELDIVWAEEAIVRFDLFDAKDLDLFAGNVTLTAEREKVVDFSSPFFTAITLLVERRGEESDDPCDLHGKRVATIERSSYEQILKTIPGVKIVYTETAEPETMNQQLFEMIETGKADAAAIDSPQYLLFADRYPELTLTIPLSETASYAFLMRQGDPLKAQLDEHLRNLRESGRLKRFMLRAFEGRDVEAIEEMIRGLGG